MKIPAPKNPPKTDKGYEETDVQTKPLVMFTVGLIILVCVVSVLLYAVLGIMENRAFEKDAKPFFTQAASPSAPPMPQLEVHPSQELSKYRKEMDTLKTSYDWVDREKKIARIPIEEAVKLTLKKGLPVRGEKQGAAS